jgi:C_GCAxxG_C_C family probable redox protein
MSTERVQAAVDNFQSGMNCSQAVLLAYGEPVGLDHQKAAAMVAAFGGGIGMTGRTCGAAIAAMMVLGLRTARAGRPIAAHTTYSYALARDFIRLFEARNGTISCRELVGAIDTPEGLRMAEERNQLATLCPKLVQDAAEILELLLASANDSAKEPS